MEEFKKVTEEFTENMSLLDKKVIRKISAKDIVFGSKNESIRGTERFALLRGENGTEYYSNSIFVIKKGFIPEIDKIFEENSDKIVEGQFSESFFYPQEYDLNNKVEVKALDTKLSCEISTSFINSHYYRYFLQHGACYFRCGIKNTAVIFGGGNGIVGLIMGVKTPDDFEEQLTLEELKENLKLIEEFKEYSKEQLIKNIVEAKIDEVISKTISYNTRFKDNLDGELTIFQNVSGYYDIGYNLKQPLQFHDKDISVFSSASSDGGYNEYIKEGKHFDGPKQKITKSESEKLSLAMLNELQNRNINDLIANYCDNNSKEFKEFEKNLSLLEDLTNNLCDALKKNPLHELKYWVNNVFKFKNIASVTIELTSYSKLFRVQVENNQFVLRDVHNECNVIMEGTTKENVINYIVSIADKEAYVIEQRNSQIAKIKDYTYGHLNLIIEVEGIRYLATEHGYQAIVRGKTSGTGFRYKESRAEHIYNLFIEGEISTFKIHNDSNLTKAFIDNLPDISIKDIVTTEEDDCVEMKMLFNLNNASNEKEVLKVLGDILMQSDLQIRSNTILSELFTKKDDLGAELHKRINELVDKVLENIESSTEEELWILRGFESAIPDLSEDISDKIDLALTLKSQKEALIEDNSSSENNSNLSVISTETIHEDVVNDEVVNNIATVDTIKDVEVIECQNQSINEAAEINSDNVQDLEEKSSASNNSVKKYFDSIVDTIEKLEWSISILHYSNNIIKADITNKYNHTKVEGLYAGVKGDNSEELVQLLSDYYSAPIYALPEN